jgi:hypothetical protein
MNAIASWLRNNLRRRAAHRSLVRATYVPPAARGRAGLAHHLLIIIVGGLVALGVVAGPWVPGAITVVAGLTAGGAAVAKRIGSKAVEKAADPTPVPPPEPDPALDPPP